MRSRHHRQQSPTFAARKVYKHGVFQRGCGELFDIKNPAPVRGSGLASALRECTGTTSRGWLLLWSITDHFSRVERKLFSDNVQRAGSVDSDSNRVRSDSDDSDLDVVANQDPLSGLTRKNQHTVPPWTGSRTYPHAAANPIDCKGYIQTNHKITICQVFCTWGISYPLSKERG